MRVPQQPAFLLAQLAQLAQERVDQAARTKKPRQSHVWARGHNYYCESCAGEDDL
jgi:hypothetical protein